MISSPNAGLLPEIDRLRDPKLGWLKVRLEPNRQLHDSFD
jgi:hypothetical protein